MLGSVDRDLKVLKGETADVCSLSSLFGNSAGHCIVLIEYQDGYPEAYSSKDIDDSQNLVKSLKVKTTGSISVYQMDGNRSNGFPYTLVA